MINGVIIVKILGNRKIGILVLGFYGNADRVIYREQKIDLLLLRISAVLVVEGAGESDHTRTLVVDLAELLVSILDRDNIILDRVSTFLTGTVLEITGIVFECHLIRESICELVTGLPFPVIGDLPFDSSKDRTVISYSRI